MNTQKNQNSQPRWDMELTRELVRTNYGDSQLTAIRPVLRAVATRLLHARIHFQDYQRLVSSHLDQPLEGGTPWWDLMWMSEDDGIGSNNYFFVATEACIYASVQAMHAIADNLAHVVYYTLGWNTENRPPLKRLSLEGVYKRLKQDVSTVTGLAPVQQAFEVLCTDQNYKALSDVTNHIKHHGGLPVSVSWGVSEQASYEIFLSAFSREQAVQPPREVELFLKETYDTMNQAVVATGWALNEWLQSTNQTSQKD